MAKKPNTDNRKIMKQWGTAQQIANRAGVHLRTVYRWRAGTRIPIAVIKLMEGT